MRYVNMKDILSMKLWRKFKLKKYNVLIKYHICIFVIYSSLLDIDYSKYITTFSQMIRSHPINK